ncbi:MAG: bifunctional hydroxymethylpyrimidine kinase/phosphomethylpyrimidine kinase [Desulfovibrio sp.]|nr:MAG: bifunctional hydroxymethylpyrimidine kinase/phosphomethylpyrimidine kinase [Desulfovibrio sp.]
MGIPPTILTIAGSDSGGGAGIQADLKAIAVLGGFGTSVITALTAQNGLGVSGIHAPEPNFVLAQLEAVLTGFPVKAAKTGMLFSQPIISALAERLKDKDFPLVVDPVSMSQSRHQILQDDAVDALREEILPLADLLTPNVPEAELLTGLSAEDRDGAFVVLEKLLDMGPGAVLLKGGHAVSWGRQGDERIDFLALPGQAPQALSQPHVDTDNTHGTGCTLSAAIAALLGAGHDMIESVTRAQAYLNQCLRMSYAPGKGFGPVNHMAPLLS